MNEYFGENITEKAMKVDLIIFIYCNYTFSEVDVMKEVAGEISSSIEYI